MKYLKYNFLQSMLDEQTPILMPKQMNWTEGNEEIAKREAYNGEYTIEDDGQQEPIQPVVDISVWDELDAAYREGVDSI